MVSKHAAWAVALFPLTLAYAQPQIAVKARAYVDDVRAFARGRDVTVTGALRDDRGQAVPGERVRVADTTVVTGADGRFTTSFVIQTEGRRTLEVHVHRARGVHLCADGQLDLDLRPPDDDLDLCRGRPQ